MYTLVWSDCDRWQLALSSSAPHQSSHFSSTFSESATIAVLKWQFFKLDFTLKKPLVKGQKTKGYSLKIVFCKANHLPNFKRWTP